MKAVATSLALAILCILGPFTADAATPFDGVWTGRSVTEYGRCPYVYDVTLSIRDGVVTGHMVTGSERITIATTVDDQGRMARVFGYNGRTVLKTTGGRLGVREGRIDWMGHALYVPRNGSGLCYGVITLNKVTERPQRAEPARAHTRAPTP